MGIDKLIIKNFDTMNGTSSIHYIAIPDNIGELPKKGYAYVIISNCILLTGGFSLGECLRDSIKINLNNLQLKRIKAHLIIPRMNHSILYIDELDSTLVVGGEVENGSLLDSCEILRFKDKKWK